jgi:tartrate-resistant acid phosphatase type 5
MHSPNKFDAVLGDERPRRSKRGLMIGVVALVALVGVAVGVFFVAHKPATKVSNASEGSGNKSNSTSKATPKPGAATSGIGFANSTESVSGVAGTVRPAGGNDTLGAAESGTAQKTAPTTDPTKAVFSLHALAIGDWGVSLAGDSCCAKYEKEDGQSLYRDEQAQDQVSYLLALSAKELKPKVILSHGDNFYWNGVGMGDQSTRFTSTFEEKYHQPSLQNIPWLNVMGNHDYGGSALLCGDRDDEWVECKSAMEMEKGLEGRFTAQSSYVSPNGDRWKLPSHYYKETIKDAASGVTVDIFNVDTNAATVHGAEQVCCQCFGYMGPKKKTDPDYVNCNTVHRGHRLCFGGDNVLFDACMAKFKAWTDDSLKQLIADTQASKADWKIVNSHYSPHFHMDPPMMKKWFDALEKGGVQLFINGHTHAESHETSTFNTHFITNGAGGGIQSESIGKPPPGVTNVESVWIGADAPYGFFELSFSKDWLRAQFITFDKGWTFAKDPSETVRGSKQVGHCWYIPKDGSTGQKCVL